MPVRSDLYESDSKLTAEANQGVHHCWMEDVERLDEIIGQYISIALNAERDFDQALRAAYVTLELIEVQTTLLESHPKGTP